MTHAAFENAPDSNADEPLEYLRAAVASAGSSASALGWQTERWLAHREQMLDDVTQLLSPESIEAEMRVRGRGDVLQLLARLAAAVRGDAR
jgi:hypothetical protein